MSYSKISKRYAKALFGFSQEQNSLETIKNDMDYIHELCNVSPDFVAMLESPVIKIHKKMEIITEIMQKNVCETTMKFLAIVSKSRREKIIPSLSEEFILMYNDFSGIKKVQLYSAVALPQELTTKINTMLAEQTKKKIELSEHIQEDLIGGFVIKMDDLLYDASLKNELNKIKNELSQ